MTDHRKNSHKAVRTHDLQLLLTQLNHHNPSDMHLAADAIAQDTKLETAIWDDLTGNFNKKWYSKIHEKVLTIIGYYVRNDGLEIDPETGEKSSRSTDKLAFDLRTFAKKCEKMINDKGSYRRYEKVSTFMGDNWLELDKQLRAYRNKLVPTAYKTFNTITYVIDEMDRYQKHYQNGKNLYGPKPLPNTSVAHVVPSGQVIEDKQKAPEQDNKRKDNPPARVPEYEELHRPVKQGPPQGYMEPRQGYAHGYQESITPSFQNYRGVPDGSRVVYFRGPTQQPSYPAPQVPAGFPPMQPPGGFQPMQPPGGFQPMPPYFGQRR